jgi:hypothetical protein
VLVQLSWTWNDEDMISQRSKSTEIPNTLRDSHLYENTILIPVAECELK